MQCSSGACWSCLGGPLHDRKVGGDENKLVKGPDKPCGNARIWRRTGVAICVMWPAMQGASLLSSEGVATALSRQKRCGTMTLLGCRRFKVSLRRCDRSVDKNNSKNFVEHVRLAPLLPTTCRSRTAQETGRSSPTFGVVQRCRYGSARDNSVAVQASDVLVPLGRTYGPPPAGVTADLLRTVIR